MNHIKMKHHQMYFIEPIFKEPIDLFADSRWHYAAYQAIVIYQQIHRSLIP